MTVITLPRNIAGRVIAQRLFDALDDCEQLAEDYNASPELDAAVTGWLHLIENLMRNEGHEVGAALQAGLAAALEQAGVSEDTHAYIERYCV